MKHYHYTICPRRAQAESLCALFVYFVVSRHLVFEFARGELWTNHVVVLSQVWYNTLHLREKPCHRQ